MGKLIDKYNISEKDLYTLGVIELKKSKAGFFDKEKLKAKSLGILKPYNVKFIDLGVLLNEIKSSGFHTNQMLIEKYGAIDIDSKSSSFGFKYFVPIIIGIVVFFYVFNSSGSNSDTNTESNTESNNSSEEASKNAYRQGYSDGQMGYGLSASEVASASESYMAHGYNFSSADIAVYEMGYNDGLYGRSKQY